MRSAGRSEARRQAILELRPLGETTRQIDTSERYARPPRVAPGCAIARYWRMHDADAPPGRFFWRRRIGTAPETPRSRRPSRIGRSRRRACGPPCHVWCPAVLDAWHAGPLGHRSPSPLASRAARPPRVFRRGVGVCSAEPWSDWRGREPTDFSKILGLRLGEPRRKFKRTILPDIRRLDNQSDNYVGKTPRAAPA